ncbi:hypothetical protein [Bifidobacterium samirii]|nr:hypothetical protein [Bifidobacterium samirii]
MPTMPAWAAHPMPARIRRAIAAVAIAAAVLTTAAGCDGPFSLPSSGAVQTLAPAEPRDRRIYTAPSGPSDGMTPEVVVEGFFDAMPAGVQSDGYRTARMFLAADAASWDGDVAAAVIIGEPRFTRRSSAVGGSHGSGESVVAVDVQVAGRLDRHGLYTVYDDVRDETLAYTLVMENGEWRIADLPAGVLISQTDFDQVYRQVTVQRTDAAHRTLIPDIRWLAWRDWYARAVRETLAAPPDRLGGAAADVAAGRVTLVDAACSIEGDITVTLSASFDDADDPAAPDALDDDTRALLVRLIRLTLADGDLDYETIRILADGGRDHSLDDVALTLGAAD